jgi:hypothetical protein
MNNEGDAVLNWSPQNGVNKTISDIITTTLFNCNIALEAMSEVPPHLPSADTN